MNFKLIIILGLILQACGVKNNPVAPAGSKPLLIPERKYLARPALKNESKIKKEEKEKRGIDEAQ